MSNDPITTPILTNIEQYRSDLHVFPALSRTEQEVLAELARGGDADARERLIIEGAQFVAWYAVKLVLPYMRYDKDYLDLCEIGNLTLVEHIDRVLAMGKALAYLCGIARKEMRYAVLYKRSLISLPMNQALPKEQPHVDSLDYLESGQTWVEIEASLKSLTEESGQAEAASTLYGPLQQALQSLTNLEREVVVRHHGLDGGTTEPLGAIDKQIGGYNKRAHQSYYRALKKLQRQLKQA